MDRTILHCDMNGFFASVELLDHPELKNKPMAVCGNPRNRHGIILAKNEIAKKFGIVTAETLWQAKKKCPGLICVSPHMGKYKKYSRIINNIYERYTDMVEPFSIDESWLDVSASMKLFGSGREIADAIRITIKEELGLTLSVGVSFNKIFAKMGSEYKKPDATTVISRENYREILWPLPVEKMFFVGSASAEKLIKTGILTIGDLALAPKRHMISLLGKHGEMIHEYANGLDQSPVSLSWERDKIKSVGNGITFKRDLLGEEDIKTALTGLSDKVASRLRKYEMKAGGIKLDIKDPGFNVISRQKQLGTPTNISEEISKAAFEVFLGSWDKKKPVRLLTLTGITLCSENDNEQLSLFANDNEVRNKKEKIERTLDDIRHKYGDSSISFGRVIDNDIGISLDLHTEEDSK
ncbi:MAG TPA: DNA polymerase IV [Bacillota bacterium]|nr:DNA polymerase IV [Bacillota bacterium]